MIRIFFIIVLIYSSNLLFGQTDTVLVNGKINGTYFVSYWHDTKAIISKPIQWKGKQWATFAGVAGLTGLTYIYDKEIFDFFERNVNNTSDQISQNFIEPWGSGLYSLPLLAGVYLTGTKNSRHKNIALTGVKAFILSGGAAVLLKHAFHRYRPNENLLPNPRAWDGPIPFSSDHLSFPSGHTTTAFSVASVLAYGYKDKTWVGISAYTMAGLVGLSRIHDGKHWASDVVAGAALGTFVGVTLSKLNLNKIQVSPVSLKGGYGMCLVYQVN
ncbi:MAG: phosphatase PAP2 family protein [Bacteroidales bacterium]|nr:phosphatase PAP2 family protein [Bacteroidales bacterium]MCF8403749.1 phosphatase PAP2 family protein [Bacteroidales bacterium]